VKRVAVDIVTGFLGAGKTTLLARALKGPLSRPDVVFVVNEIGEIGLDGKVLTGFAAAERVVELASGCICCSIEDARFDLAIRELVERYDPALVVIETTGLADPVPLEERVVAAGLGLDAVITVVDAPMLDVTARQARVVRRQVEAADFIVMTKTDLCSSSELARARKRVSRWNRRARVFDAVRGEVGSELLFGLAMRRYRSGETGATAAGRAHLTEDGIASVSIRSERPLDRARFERFLKKLPSSVIRAKGIASIDGTPWRCVFNYTCGRYEMDWIEWPGGGVGTEAVFLGKNIAKVESTLAEGLTRCQAE
jgi:cobalamin biosynthesis protein CobW